MKNPKNKCKYCGGQLVIEYIGSYGLIYPMKSNGEPYKNPVKKIIYELHGEDTCMIYCSTCKKLKE